LTFVCCECCVLSGRGLCDEIITRPGESYRRWCVVECDLETSWMRRPWPTGGSVASKTKNLHMIWPSVQTSIWCVLNRRRRKIVGDFRLSHQWRFKLWCSFLCSVDRASLYNLCK